MYSLLFRGLSVAFRAPDLPRKTVFVFSFVPKGSPWETCSGLFFDYPHTISGVNLRQSYLFTVNSPGKIL